ncbi:hypothetical protein TNCV_425121 [Trichonephila clavipes]|nr:hypothetical protein TNCV_425121 [Trichonephila clavipes]
MFSCAPCICRIVLCLFRLFVCFGITSGLHGRTALRTAYSQAGRRGQPKPSSLRAQAQLSETKTETMDDCELLREERKENAREVREQALPSGYYRQTYLLKYLPF